MRHLVLKLVPIAALVFAGVELSNRQASKAFSRGQLSACSEMITAFQSAGLVNPQVACEVYKGKVGVGFPNRQDAPHYSLSGVKL